MRWPRRRLARDNPESDPLMDDLPPPVRRSRPVAMPGPFDALARYNGERARGLVHTPEWDARMAALQAEWDEWVRAFRLPADPV